MGKLLDFLGKLSESSIEITDPVVNKVVNNYYIYSDNRVIKVTPDEFKKYIEKHNLKIENKTKSLEAKGWK